MAEPQIPNTGRILDVWLGGSHHYPVDAAAAAAFDDIYGRFPEVFTTLRRFIARNCQYIAAQGIDRFLVIGAGIPSQGNVHEAVANAKVLYSDIDADNIRIGNEILAGNPNCQYIFADATNPDALYPQIRASFLGDLGSSPVGIILIGVAVFLNDTQLRDLLNSLYSHCPAGSFLGFDFDSPQLTHYPAALAMLGANFFPRNPNAFQALLGNWELTNDGILPVQAWRTDTIEPGDLPVFMYGGVAKK